MPALDKDIDSPRTDLVSVNILNALSDPVCVLDAKDDFAYLNSAAEQFFQSSEAALIGCSLQDIVPHDSPILSLVHKVRRTNSSMSQYGVALATPRIGEHQLDIDATPLTESAGNIVLTLRQRSIAGKIDRSLTHRGAARSVTAMSAVLAHEIKNPLSGVRGAAQLLEQSISTEDHELTRLIIEEADRICALVDRMEVFAERPQIERGAVNIHEVLNHVVKLAEAGFGQGVRIVERYDPSLPPAFGDRDQMIQVFLNLIKNAVEAAVSNNDPEVVVSTAFQHGIRMSSPTGGDRVHLPLVVSLQDNGDGIPEDLRTHLFDPFITTKPSGTGLGLALVAKFVGDHGGVIDFDTQPRRTIFRVMLPMMKDQE